MKVYISGQISGLPMDKVKAKFEAAEFELEVDNFEPISPLKIHDNIENKTWADFLAKDIEVLLKDCHGIYMLKDWGFSQGARIEHAIALEFGMTIFFQGR